MLQLLNTLLCHRYGWQHKYIRVQHHWTTQPAWGAYIHTVCMWHAVDSEESTAQQPGMNTGPHCQHICSSTGTAVCVTAVSIPRHCSHTLAAHTPAAVVTQPTDYSLHAGCRQDRISTQQTQQARLCSTDLCCAEPCDRCAATAPPDTPAAYLPVALAAATPWLRIPPSIAPTPVPPIALSPCRLCPRSPQSLIAVQQC
jgi:hypothetical protein